MNVKNTRSAVEYTITQPAVEDEITRQAAEIENARKSVEDAIAKHAEDYAFSKQAEQDEIARQTTEREKVKQFLEVEEARQTEDHEVAKQAEKDALAKQAVKNEMTKQALEDTLSKKTKEDTIVKHSKQNALKRKSKYNEIKKQALHKKIIRQKLHEKSLLQNAKRVIIKQAKFENMHKHAKNDTRAIIAIEHEMTQRAANDETIRYDEFEKMFGLTNGDDLSGSLTKNKTSKPALAKTLYKQTEDHAITSLLKKTKTASKTAELDIVQQAKTNCIIRKTVDDTMSDQAKGDTQETKEAHQSINFILLERENGCTIQIKTNKRKFNTETSMYVDTSIENASDQESSCINMDMNNISLQNNKSEHQNQKNDLTYESKASRAPCTVSSYDPALKIFNNNQFQTFVKNESPLSMHLQESLIIECLVLETLNSDVIENLKDGSASEIVKNTEQPNALQSCIMLNSETTQTTEGFSLINIKYISLLEHYKENLKMVHKILITDQNLKEYSYKNTFKANMIEHYEKLKNIYTDVKEIEIKSHEYALKNNQNKTYVTISYNNYIKLNHLDYIVKISKENMLFYNNLNKFVDNEFLKEDFTFNNLYALIIQKVQKVRIDVYTEKEFNYLKFKLYKILKQSSKSTMLYFFEIPKLIKYLETRKFDELAYNIDDVGVYFAILNVFNTLIAKNWFSMIKNCVSPNYKNINRTDVFKIVENEKHRQIFYKILLYVIRPFVSVKRYQEVWSKNICQDLVVMHLQEHWNYKVIATNCYAKLVYYQIYEIFAFEIDTVNNVLINKTDDDNSIYKAVKYMINHNNYSNLNYKFGQKMFFQRLQLIISCILKYLKSNEKRNDEEKGISKSYIDYFSQMLNNTIDFDQNSFKFQIPDNHINIANNNISINKTNETWYQQLDYYNNLYLV
ncbi:hypothetical protein COBT_002870, partial [Conglomerata obtusa]